MKVYIAKTIVSVLSLLVLSGFGARAQSQQQELPDFAELAEKEADRLETLLDLDGYQLFYVDSTLKHDYVAMADEMSKLQASKVSNTSLYQSVQDKWMEAIDVSFKRILNDTQWEAYLKSGAGKAQKQRDKRREQAEKALLK